MRYMKRSERQLEAKIDEEEMERYLKLEKMENFKRNLFQPKGGEALGHAHFVMQFAESYRRKLLEDFKSDIHPQQRTLS